jgi:hypothetical protein
MGRPSLIEIARPSSSQSRTEAHQPAAFSNTVIYFPAAHLVAAVAICISRAPGLSAAGWFYARQLANALLSFAAIYSALRLLRQRGGNRWRFRSRRCQ